MSAIFKREFKSYFQTVIGWLFIAASLLIFGLYFYVYNLNYGYAYISYSLSAISFVTLITVPVLTMRILAEDRRNKIDQLILTSPISVEKVVFAKFLSMAAIFSITIGIICLAPIFMSFFGTIPMLESYVAILGFWLYGLTCIAIGTFVSSLTENQVISAIATFALLFLGYMMNGATSALFASDNILKKILNCYDLLSPLDNLTNGVLDIGGIVYYVSVTLLFLFLTVQVIQKRRWSMNSKKIKLGVFSSGMIVVAVAVTVAVNLVVSAMPATMTSIDVTNEKLFQLTDETEGVLADLNEDITISVYATEAAADSTVVKTLDQYEGSSSHIKVKYVDPAKYPKFYEKYTDDDSNVGGALFIESAERSKMVSSDAFYESTVDYSTYQQQTTGYDAEGQITSAIEYVTAENMPVLYEITGHNETAVSGNFKEVITKANMSTESLTLLEQDAIPDDAAAIIINGPTTDFSADDAEKVITYLNNGGKAFIATTYTTEDMTNFMSVLGEYDITVADGVVMEGDTSSYYQVPYYLLPNVESVDETASVKGAYVFAPAAQGMTYPEDTGDSLTIQSILTTSDSSYAKADVANMQSYDKEEGDTDGPFSLGVEAVKTIDEDTSSEVIVFSCAQMFTDDADSVVSKKNSALFSDCITTLVSTDDTATVVVPVKEYDLTSITVSASVLIAARILLLCVIPVVLVALGFIIWILRRKK